MVRKSNNKISVEFRLFDVFAQKQVNWEKNLKHLKKIGEEYLILYLIKF